MFLAVHNSSIGDLVTDWLSEPLLILEHKELPLRPVTFEIFDQSDEETWANQHFDKKVLTMFYNVYNLWQFLTFWIFVYKFDPFWYFCWSQYWLFFTTFTILKKEKNTIIDNFWQCWQFWQLFTFFTFFYNFHNFWQF